MGSLSMRGIALAGMVAIMLLASGCATTKVTFKGPPGAVMFVDNKPYHLPAQIDLTRPVTVGKANRYDVSLSFTSSQSQEVRAKGYIDVFGYVPSDVDNLAVNTCNMEEAELVKVLSGAVVIFRGQSASHQAIYDLTLGTK